jgi:hypothetical protein
MVKNSDGDLDHQVLARIPKSEGRTQTKESCQPSQSHGHRDGDDAFDSEQWCYLLRGIFISRPLTTFDSSRILGGVKHQVCHTLNTRVNNVVGALEWDGDKNV